MAVDKLVDSTQLDADLTSVANAIRAKSGGSSQLAFPSGFVSEIGNIPSGGGDSGVVETAYFSLHYATVTVGQVSISNTEALVNLVYGLADIPDDGTIVLNKCFWAIEQITHANNEVFGTSYNGSNTDYKVFRWRNNQWNSTPVNTSYDAANPPSGRKYLVSWIEKETSEI